MEHLGSGQFGTVDKGVWQGPRGKQEVAIKLLKSGASEDDRVKFLKEAAIMGQFSHRNVISLHGVVTLGEPVSLSLSPASFVTAHRDSIYYSSHIQSTSLVSSLVGLCTGDDCDGADAERRLKRESDQHETHVRF